MLHVLNATNIGNVSSTQLSTHTLNYARAVHRCMCIINTLQCSKNATQMIHMFQMLFMLQVSNRLSLNCTRDQSTCVSHTLFSVVQMPHTYIHVDQVSNSEISTQLHKSSSHVQCSSVHKCYTNMYIQAFQVSNTAHVTSFKSTRTQMHESAVRRYLLVPRSLLLPIDVVNSAQRDFGQERNLF